MIILAGSSNRPLAESIASHLNLTVPPSSTGHFSDGELRFSLPLSVRGHPVFLIQSGYSTATAAGPDEYLMELCMMIRACREASAGRITCVIPCFPYGIDRESEYPSMKTIATFDSCSERDLSNFPISSVEASVASVAEADYSTSTCCPEEKSLLASNESFLLFPPQSTTLAASQDSAAINHYRKWSAKPGKLVATCLQVSGADHILCLDLHHPQFQGFFDVPLDDIPSTGLALDAFQQWCQQANCSPADSVIMSPDVGGSKRGLALSTQLGIPFAALGPSLSSLLGSIPEGRSVFLLDDLLDTGAKVSWALEYLFARMRQQDAAKRGNLCMNDYSGDSCNSGNSGNAKDNNSATISIGVFVTHALFAPGSIERLQAALQLNAGLSIPVSLFLTDSVRLSDGLVERLMAAGFSQVRVLGVGSLLAETIAKLHRGESVSQLW